jgi:4-hydroxy-tetrahydrodipicolinate reductase
MGQSCLSQRNSAIRNPQSEIKSEMVRIAIHGAAGRMGQRLIALASADPELTVVAALESARHPSLGQDVGVVAGIGTLGVTLTSELAVPVDVLLDFSTPAAAEAIVKTCREPWPPPASTAASRRRSARHRRRLPSSGPRA